MYQRILLATDGSRLSGKAEDAAIALAAACGATLVALCVAPKHPKALLLLPTVFATGISDVRAQFVDAARDTAAKALRRAERQGVRATAANVSASSPAEGIVAYARKARCDLIVMASHGRRGMDRLLLGSETQHVLVHTNVPVLVVR
jgi:nucleotide-binding universal stress UspA family protein